MDIHFRPHHFLCALCFQGRGYSPAFVSNFEVIMAYLKASDATPIRVIAETDSICSPCPHRLGKTCQTEEKIAVLDKAHASALHLQAGDLLTWGEAKQRIADHITLDTFHRICATCQWKEWGICESVIRDL